MVASVYLFLFILSLTEILMAERLSKKSDVNLLGNCKFGIFKF